MNTQLLSSRGTFLAISLPEEFASSMISVCGALMTIVICTIICMRI
ncbi:MAG: hypothetical protein ACLFSB_15765 [Chitinispirillaceae bacterium]